jgi:signal transduction histidine kinase
MRTFLGLPLRVGHEVFGNFYLSDKEGGGEFSDADEHLLSRFSAQAGLTVAFARQLQDEEQRLLEAVVEHAPYGLAYFPADPSLDPFGNGAAKRMIGRISRASAPGSTFALHHPDGRPLAEDELPVGRALREGAVINLEVLVRRKDDSATTPALVSAAPVYSGTGSILGAVIVLQDISARKELDRLREDFTAMVAHDLRTPLQAVLMQVEALIMRAAAGETTVAVDTLQRIKASGRRLELMVRDLLDASRIDARQLLLERRPVDLAATASALVAQLRVAFGGRDIRVEVVGTVPPVEADPHRVEQILTNLLENAVKYSAAGEPIRIGLSARDGGVEVTIEDRGPGIEPEELPHLFDRYYQTRRARAAGLGLGLGLYITHGLVEAHGGRILVESTPGLGSVFRVWLPEAPGGT